MRQVHFKIHRRDNPHGPRYWQEFRVDCDKGMTVADALRALGDAPVDVNKQTVRVVEWESDCRSDGCGSCTMLINGQPRAACETALAKLSQPITLEPLSKFPNVRDLVVDRSSMGRTLKKIHAPESLEQMRHAKSSTPSATPFAECHACGACLEACPQFHRQSPYMGAFAFGQVFHLNRVAQSRADADARLDAIMGMGGIVDCGNAQNCTKVCPKDLPLTDAIAQLGADTTGRALRRMLK